MPPSSLTIDSHFYAPVVGAAGFDEMLAAIEAVLPIPRPAWRIEDAGGNREVDLPRLLDPGEADEGARICDADEQEYVSLSADLSLHGTVENPLFHIEVKLWGDTRALLGFAFELACRLGPAARAYTGTMIDTEAAAGIVGGYMDSPFPGVLPAAHPHLIGWINYWSAEACALVGFSRSDPRCALFARVERCEGGGMAFQLTDEPLDLADPAHRATLDAAWQAFPTIPRKRGRLRATA